MGFCCVVCGGGGGERDREEGRSPNIGVRAKIYDMVSNSLRYYYYSTPTGTSNDVVVVAGTLSSSVTVSVRITSSFLLISNIKYYVVLYHKNGSKRERDFLIP